MVKDLKDSHYPCRHQEAASVAGDSSRSFKESVYWCLRACNWRCLEDKVRLAC